MPKMTDRKPVAQPEKLAEILTAATRAVGGSSNEREVQLTALATGALLLGAGDDMVAASMAHFAAATTDTVADLGNLWQAATDGAPFLHPRIRALTGWLEHAGDQDVHVAKRTFAALTQIDLARTTEPDNIGSDLLGPTYLFLRSPADRKATGAFYTPWSLSSLIATMVTPREGDITTEPTCGSGGMVIAAAQAMRDRGRDPATCTWVLNDLDPLAVALAGVNAVIHGLGPRVRLCCGDGLLLGTGAPGDPLIETQPPTAA